MKLLTIAEIARRLNIPESTVRYYRDRFEKYIPDIGSGRSRRYQEDALEVFRFIADNMRSNVPAEDVEYALQSRFSVAIEPQQQSPATQQQSAAIMRELIADALRKELTDIRDEIVETKKENYQLRKLIEEGLAEQERKAKEQDEKLNEVMRLMQEIRSLQEQAAALEEQEQDKRPWWKFWSK